MGDGEMTPNDAGRSPRTDPEKPIKRGANAAYLTSRLARDHAQLLARLQAGEFPSVWAAANAAGLIRASTPLDQLKHWWRRATADDRVTCLLRIQTARLGGATGRNRPAGIRWYERLFEVRRRLQILTRPGFMEGLAKTWTPETRQGYRWGVDQLIEALRRVLADIDTVRRERSRPSRADPTERRPRRSKPGA
jgi:hypothetical protein